MKVVINGGFGGFSLSPAAIRAYRSRNGKSVIKRGDGGCNIPRDDADLIAVVEDLGAAANGPSSFLHVIEIPDDVEWEIVEHDGCEEVTEKHRRWS